MNKHFLPLNMKGEGISLFDNIYYIEFTSYSQYKKYFILKTEIILFVICYIFSSNFLFFRSNKAR